MLNCEQPKMSKLCLLILSSMVITVSSVFLSDGVKNIQFKKLTDGSDEFLYEIKQNGEKFHGETYELMESTYFIFGPNSTTYWVQFTSDEMAKLENFSKDVLLVERDGKEIHFRDDFYEYFLKPFTGDLMIPLYATEWNLKNICFSKSRNGINTFDFEISSENNSRKFNGTTQHQAGNPFLQQIYLHDEPQHNGIYEVKFTDSELISNKPFRKGIAKVIEQTGALGISFAKVTNFDLLMQLNIHMNIV